MFGKSDVEIDDEQNPTAPIEIDVHGRWDALALSEWLMHYHSFLVQHDHERWTVHARAPGCHGEPLADALRAIEVWRVERGLESSSCRVRGLPYRSARTSSRMQLSERR
ncbi:MAG: hypothetical protein HOQ28_14135 [Thermoleophilia bacterium]|nr:hypothetical protein [Thermoleophilia bacterium]